MKRRPIPLEFEKPEHSNNNSFALHDAAIKSATTLMAVMNDVLKSPHLSAHFASQQSGGLQPMNGRPRSRTAPPTPMFEAPGVEPVELPGSVPVWPKPDNDTRYSMDAAVPPKRTSMSRSIPRPHSSPQASPHALHDRSRSSILATSRSASDVRTAPEICHAERQRAASVNRRPNPSGPASSTSEQVSTEKAPHHGSPYRQSNVPADQRGPLDRQGNANSNVQIPSTITTSAQGEHTSRMESQTPLEQLSFMRRSHDAYISSLKRAHDLEVESHKAYITFLENGPAIAQELPVASKHCLTLDTSHVTGNGIISLDVSASTSLQSIDSSLESQRRTSIESAAIEAEALKRKLSLCRKTQSELGDVRRERDHFREKNERNERRIIQLKDIGRKSKDTEKALKNKIQGLEAALLAANNQRVDALEGYYEACDQITTLHGKQLIMIRERDEASARLDRVKTGECELPSDQDGQVHEPDPAKSQAERDALLQQLHELRQIASDKDSRIQKLELERKDNVSKQEVCKLEKLLAEAEVVRDQYNTLLHAELRRQSKIVALNHHAATPKIEDGAAAAVAERLKSKPGSENTEKRCEFLEKELKHCFQEIILYKLDIRGYRKDLKEATARIEVLQTIRPHRPETPDSMENHTADDKSNTPGRRRGASGLGISLQRPSTPTRPSTTSLATPQHQVCTVTSPPSTSAKTPLELHKKLPEPPTASRNTSPQPALSPPTTTLNRAETLRSLSESIISSYARRATPEQGHGDMPPLYRGRSAEPSSTCGMRAHSRQAIDAIAVPISKYTSDMLKTPSMKANVVKT